MGLKAEPVCGGNYTAVELPGKPSRRREKGREKENQCVFRRFHPRTSLVSDNFYF